MYNYKFVKNIFVYYISLNEYIIIYLLIILQFYIIYNYYLNIIHYQTF